MKVQKWKNSSSIRIPSNTLKSLNIEQKDNKIIISISKKKKISITDRFKKYKGKNLTNEFSWDESFGKEI